LYIPSYTEYEIANLGDDELRCAWTISPSFDEKVTKEVKKENSKGEVRVIRTLEDVRPIVLAVKGMERSIYPISETRRFHFALFLRGPSTYAPLHTHFPQDFEEAFIVLDGKLKVSGINGESFNLGQFDCAYIPPFGGNMNENRSSETVRYLWMGSPPVNVKEIPVEKKYSKHEKALAVDKQS
ncbi:MAG: cupin domain-containing protein, partial [Nitrososphaerales archaeon]